MNDVAAYKLSGTARPKDAQAMLTEICEHFVEHAEVHRTGDLVVLKSEVGTADIRIHGSELLIDLNCPSDEMLQMSRNVIAEHLFYFAGDDPFELDWSKPQTATSVSNLHEATVVSAEDVTPHMRRVKFACSDIAPFVDGGLHVRLLVPPKGRAPVWPGLREDGRVAWPEGEDKLLPRIYTIRAVDAARGELWVDFLQHPAPGVLTPGADFARDAQAGDRVLLMGPGGGGIPEARSIFLAGDESALPAIARIIAEVAEGTKLQAIIEVDDASEEQPLPSKGDLDIRWMHRKTYPEGEKGFFAQTVRDIAGSLDKETYAWVACEKDDLRSIKAVLKAAKRDRTQMYAAWYWERGRAQFD